MADIHDRSATVSPVLGRVRIFFDEAEIASTRAAVQLERPGRPGRLFVPLDDVHPGILEASETTKDDAELGEGRFYTIKTLTADGVDEAWYYPYAEGIFAPLRGLVTFGGDRVTQRVSSV